MDKKENDDCNDQKGEGLPQPVLLVLKGIIKLAEGIIDGQLPNQMGDGLKECIDDIKKDDDDNDIELCSK